MQSWLDPVHPVACIKGQTVILDWNDTTYWQIKMFIKMRMTIFHWKTVERNMLTFMVELWLS